MVNQMTSTMSQVLGCVSPRQTLISVLRGRSVDLPDLRAIFVDWERKQDASWALRLAELRQIVNQRIQSLGFRPKKCKALCEADFGLFTSLWWPAAQLQELRVLAFLVIWLFTWDDEIDEPAGACSDNMNVAEEYRNSTIDFVTFCLKQSPQSSAFLQNTSDESDIGRSASIVRSFEPIGDALRQSYSGEQNQRFIHTLALFMKASKQEQEMKLADVIPTLDQYWNFRLGTSAVFIGLAAGEYSGRFQLPQSVMQSDAMESIWKETNIIISITNDLLSLKKEARQGCMESIVPLDFAATGDLSGAIDRSVKSLSQSKERFDEAAETLIDRSVEGSPLRSDLQFFIEICRSNCVGNLTWSLATTRYDMEISATPTGHCVFTL